MFNYFRKELDWGGRKLILETGKMARQADGAVLARYGDTIVLCTAVGQTWALVGVSSYCCQLGEEGHGAPDDAAEAAGAAPKAARTPASTTTVAISRPRRRLRACGRNMTALLDGGGARPSGMCFEMFQCVRCRDSKSTVSDRQ